MKKLGDQTASRRTLVKGVAWSVPAVTVATAAPALASSPVTDEPPVIVKPPLGTGDACKFSGKSCGSELKHSYRYQFCFENTTDKEITVSLVKLTVNGKDAGIHHPTSKSVTIPAGKEICAYVVTNPMGDSENGQACLTYSYSWNDDVETDTVCTGVLSLPPCEDCATE